MRTLIVNPTVRYYDHPRHVPIGELQLLAILRRDHPNIEFRFYDANAHRVDDFWHNRFDGLHKVLQEDEFDVIAIGGLITAYNYIKKALRKARAMQPDAKIVVGGGFFSAIPSDIMNFVPEIDYGIVGEAYRTFPELLKAISAGEEPSHVQGLIYRGYGEGRLHFTSPRELIPDMDWLPYPAYDLAPLDIYFQHSGILMSDEAMRAKKRLDACMSLSCPFLCGFCWDLGITSVRSYENFNGRMQPEQGRPGRKSVVRQHSPRYIAKYLKWMRKTFTKIEPKGVRVDFVAWVDENIVAHDAQTGFTWLKEIEDELWKRKLIPECVQKGEKHDNSKHDCLHHGGTSHAGLCKKETMETMRNIGFTYLDYGLEHFDANILKSLGKGATPEANKEAIRITKEAGINPIPNQIIMFPQENWKTIRTMLDAWEETGIVSMPFLATAYPGSQWYAQHYSTIMTQYSNDLEAFIEDLEDATKVTALLADNFSPAEAVGTQQIMAQATKTGDFKNARRLLMVTQAHQIFRWLKAQ